MININMEKARKIWRDKIAESRKAAFEKNDIAIRDAQISNDEEALEHALSRRDELRAIGDLIDAAKTPSELMAVKP